jgi:predicted alternative tryptophan synthase beta-subunit
MIRKFIKQKTSAPGSVEIKSRGGIEYTIETSGARFSCANLGNHFVVHRKHKTVMRLPTIRVKTEQEPQPQTR